MCLYVYVCVVGRNAGVHTNQLHPPSASAFFFSENSKATPRVPPINRDPFFPARDAARNFIPS